MSELMRPIIPVFMLSFIRREHKIKEGRTLEQLKPKRIYVVENEEDFIC
jgi:hypothetical protein